MRPDVGHVIDYSGWGWARSAKETIPASINRDTFLPIHPGALRYYREIGIDAPAILAADRRSQ
jgi:hypothetical protein